MALCLFLGPFGSRVFFFIFFLFVFFPSFLPPRLLSRSMERRSFCHVAHVRVRVFVLRVRARMKSLLFLSVSFLESKE